MTHPYLEWTDENQQEQRIEIVDRISIGRTCKGIDPNKRVLLKLPMVSRDHAEISRTSGGFRITDNSINGTWVNDVRMAAGSSRELADGDTIRIGYIVMRVVCPEAAADSQQRHAAATELTIVSSLEEVVTAVVTDMRGFSAFCQTHDSVHVYDMINEIFERFSRIVEDFKGTVKDYAGDSVVAFWEHQFGDSAGQSELASQAAIKQMQSFNQIRGKLSMKHADVEHLRMGWGVTTGRVTLAHYGSRISDLAMVGDCINLASRFSGMANKTIPENIIVCSETAKLIGDRLELKDLGMHSIPGRKGQERIFALLTVS